MYKYKDSFDKYFKTKKTPNDFELELFSKAQKYIRKTNWIPWILFVGVWNSLSMYSTKPTSDIDLFVITRRNRTWLVRFLLTSTLFILWVWRKWEENAASNFCLSFFCDEDSLDFSKIAIENDIYLFFWMLYLKPIIDKNWTYRKFIDSNKDLWLETQMLSEDKLDYLINDESKFWKILDSRFFDPLFSFIDLFWFWLYGSIFKKISPKTKKVRRPFWVVITRKMLKFHDTDPRYEIRDSIISN